MARRERLTGETAGVPPVEIESFTETPRIDLIFRGSLNATPVKQALLLLRERVRQIELAKARSPKVCVIDTLGVQTINSKEVRAEMQALLEYVPLKVGRHLILVTRNDAVTMFMRAAILGCGLRFYVVESRSDAQTKVEEILTLTSAVDV